MSRSGGRSGGGRMLLVVAVGWGGCDWVQLRPAKREGVSLWVRRHVDEEGAAWGAKSSGEQGFKRTRIEMSGQGRRCGFLGRACASVLQVAIRVVSV